MPSAKRIAFLSAGSIGFRTGGGVDWIWIAGSVCPCESAPSEVTLEEASAVGWNGGVDWEATTACGSFSTVVSSFISVAGIPAIPSGSETTTSSNSSFGTRTGAATSK